MLIVREGLMLPMGPNFIRTHQGATIPIQDLPDKTLRAIGKAMGEDMVRRAKAKRKPSAPRSGEKGGGR